MRHNFLKHILHSAKVEAGIYKKNESAERHT